MDLNYYRGIFKSKRISFSQALQDVFALLINDYKVGTCLDIGSSSPYEMYNNSLLLQLMNWECILVDMIDHSNDWARFPKASFYNKDMIDKDNVDYVISKCYPIVDFLSLDVDDYTLECLKLINLNAIKFKSICIEHNRYLGDRGIQRFEQREILESYGYKMLIKNWHNFEDWWVHPDIVDYDKFKRLSDLSYSVLTPGNIPEGFKGIHINDILNILSPDHEKIISNITFDEKTLNNL